ncbi:hypothetical protein [Streptomyces syringium]|uniref:hypothetical protein n=1 Tax=Streptomyces syringium TaxID=76729 RepID=UPI003AAE0DFA
MPEPVIRPATHADDEELAALDRRAWSPLHAVQPRPRPPYEPFFDARHPPEQILVAESESAAPGSSAISGSPPRGVRGGTEAGGAPRHAAA